MTDHLANLAARSLGRAPVLQPRLPSRFEPVEAPVLSPKPGAWAETLEEREGGETAPGRRTSNPVSETAAPTPQRSSPRPSGGEGPGHVWQTLALGFREESDAARKGDAQSVADELARPIAPEVPVRRARVKSPGGTPVAEEDSAEPGTESGEPGVGRAPTRPAASSRERPSAGAPQRPANDVRETGETEAAPRAVVQVRARVLREPPGPHPERREAKADSAETSRTQKPTVKITIGRVEIRALGEPAKEPRPRTSRRVPHLSLQDYLKQRRARLK